MSARLCIAAARVQGATFAHGHGAMCMAGGECQSDLCSASMCVDTCTEDLDCTAGSCRWYSPVLNQYLAACNGPLGTSPNGASCTTNGDCRSGVCASGTCGQLCSTTSHCPATQVCGTVDNSVCTSMPFPGFCGGWQYNIVTACVAGTRGPGHVGDRCSAGSDCASTLCLASLGQCSDVCGRDADCPDTHRCKNVAAGPSPSGTQGYDLNVCVPRGY